MTVYRGIPLSHGTPVLHLPHVMYRRGIALTAANEIPEEGIQ